MHLCICCHRSTRPQTVCIFVSRLPARPFELAVIRLWLPLSPAVSIMVGICPLVIFFVLQDASSKILAFWKKPKGYALFLRVPLQLFVLFFGERGFKVVGKIDDYVRAIWITSSVQSSSRSLLLFPGCCIHPMLYGSGIPGFLLPWFALRKGLRGSLMDCFATARYVTGSILPVFWFIYSLTKKVLMSCIPLSPAVFILYPPLLLFYIGGESYIEVIKKGCPYCSSGLQLPTYLVR